MIRVIDPVSPYLPDEKQVVLDEDPGYRIAIHPWTRNRPEVGVSLGALKKDGTPKRVSKKKGGDEDGRRYEIAIFDREDFVEAILAVFPELQRVAKPPVHQGHDVDPGCRERIIDGHLRGECMVAK